MEAHAEAAAVWRVFEGFDLAYLFGDACEHLFSVPLISLGAFYLGAQARLPTSGGQTCATLALVYIAKISLDYEIGAAGFYC